MNKERLKTNYNVDADNDIIGYLVGRETFSPGEGEKQKF